MKKFIALIIVIASVLLLVSCAEKKDPSIPDGMTLSENESVDFYLYYPEEWSLDRNDGMVSVYASYKDRSNVSVIGMTAPADVTNVEGYLKDEYLGYVEENFESLEMLTDGEVTTLGGIDARRFVYTADIAGTPYKFMQIITYRYGYIYIFTYTSTPDFFDSHIDEVTSMAEAFEFKN